MKSEEKMVLEALMAKWREMLNIEYHMCADELESVLRHLAGSPPEVSTSLPEREVRE